MLNHKNIIIIAKLSKMAVPYNDDYVKREEEDGIEQEMHGRKQDVKAVEVPATGQQLRFLIACSILGVVWFIVSLILFSTTHPFNSEMAQLYRKEGEYKICQNELGECKRQVNHYLKERDSSNDENSKLKSQLSSCETGRLHGYILIAIPTIMIFCCFFIRRRRPGPNSESRKIDSLDRGGWGGQAPPGPPNIHVLLNLENGVDQQTGPAYSRRPNWTPRIR